MTQFTISNGKTVKKPFNKIWIILAIVIILIGVFWQFIVFDSRYFNMSQLVEILRKMFTTQETGTWKKYFSNMLDLWEPLLDTLQMSFAGTLIGSVLAFPVALLAANNIIKVPILNKIVKFLMNLVRTIPAMVLALIAVFMVGIGVLAGILAIIFFTFGIMSKMLYEVIETVDMNPFEALESTGANKLQAFNYSVVPQILPIYVSYMIYIFEVNVRASAILGFVGAGGLGSVIKVNILYNYEIVGATVIVMLVLILLVQLFSSYVRGKLQ